MTESAAAYTGQEIAIIGLSVRVNNVGTIDEFWDKLKKGIELISFYSEDELIDAGETPEIIKNPNYVKAGSTLEAKEYFDAGFFGYTPREAELLDPQTRIFHECCWQALEDAGIDPETFPGLLGVYAGAVENLEWEARVLFSGKGRSFGSFGASRLTGIRYLCTRLSYNLNLRGPSINIQTACSTSLVSIHAACQAILSGECDVATAGGVTASARQKHGYLYEDHMIFSRDGHNRTFAANASGTFFGEGAGAAILKPLENALADRDHIYAIIRSSAVNNDGSRKVGFTAPSVEAQKEMMRAAYHLAGIEPETIGYVEAHGTATPLGDPIEIEALKQAFNIDRPGICRIGSVKSNVGHLDAAAGIVGFIKAILSLKNKAIPPSLHFETPNPELKLEKSPFVVSTGYTPWERGEFPRRAVVNSLGMGGTNAHVVLEEAPQKRNSSENRNSYLLLLSAKSKESLDRAAENLADYFKEHQLNPDNHVNPGITLADAAYTLQTRRKRFQFRKALVCPDAHAAVRSLTQKRGKIREYYSNKDDKKIIFMFPGQGTQYVNMGLDLYKWEERFRWTIDCCIAIINPLLGLDLKSILYPSSPHDTARAKEEINKILITPAVVFSFEYALARLLMDWGIKPGAMIGHSFGEYTAACLAGVFSLKDALEIITFRSKLMDELPGGIMTGVPLPADQLLPLLPYRVCLGIDNGPSCIVSGPVPAVEAFEKQLKNKKLLCQRVQIKVACHSGEMNAVCREFEKKLHTIKISRPKIPFISNLTGSWITDEEAVDPTYWADHLRHTVRFADGIKTLLKEDGLIFLETGPGNVLSGIVFQYIEKDADINIINLVKHPHQDISDVAYLLDKIGQLWLYGQIIDWKSFYKKEKRHCISLPAYVFHRQRYWIEEVDIGNMGSEKSLSKRQDPANWFYTASWTRTAQLKLSGTSNHHKNKFNLLIFLDDSHIDIGARLVRKLGPHCRQIIIVKIGEKFTRTGEGEYIINPRSSDHYCRLFSEMHESGSQPGKILHLWGITDRDSSHANYLNWNPDAMSTMQIRGFYSLLYLAQAISQTIPPTTSGQIDNKQYKCEIIVVTSDMQKVTGEETIFPIKSTVLGPVYVIPQEQIGIDCRNIDITISNPDNGEVEQLTDQLTGDILNPLPGKITAYRKGHKWKQTVERIKLSENNLNGVLRKKGVYLITGGLGRVGFTLAEELARCYQGRLVLVGRSPLPDKGEKIGKIRELQEAGGEVLYISADVSDPAAVRQAKKQVEKRFGAVNGIIHAAGGTQGESIGFIRYLDPKKCQHQFNAKINGLINLDRMFRDSEPDFFILTSSMTSFLGGWEYAAYTAANFFLDNFVLENQRWISINLDPVNADSDKNIEKAINNRELLETFYTILSNVKTGQILTSVSDLHERIKKAAPSLQERITQDQPGNRENKSASLFPRPDLTTPYVPPANDIETGIVEIFQELFGYEKVGIMDNFFELGGNSLYLVKFISEIQGKFGVRISINDVFANGNILQLSGYIKNADKEKQISIEPAERKEYYLQSSAQKRLYIIQQMEVESTRYNIPYVLQLNGNLNKNRLEQVFLEMIRRHESLRTSFRTVQGNPVQAIHEEVEYIVEYHDLYQDLKGIDNQVDEIVQHFVRPFVLSHAPLIRVGLINPGYRRYIIMLDIHHIVFDGISMEIFIRELLALYASQNMPQLKLQYKDFSQWQDHEKQREARTKQGEYWLNRFKGDIPQLDFPTDFERNTTRYFDGARFEFKIDNHLSEKIRNVLAETGTTLFMMLLTVYTTLLSKYSGQEDIVVGTPIAGRRYEDLENILGMFVNMLPMRNYPEPGKTFREFLREVKENSVQAFENQDFQFDDLIEVLDLPRASNRSPLVETVFTLHHATKLTDRKNSKMSFQEADLTLESWQNYDTFSTKFNLTLDAAELNDSINMWLTYSKDLFKRTTIKKMKIHYIEILEQAVENPDIKLRDITISHSLAASRSNVLQNDLGDFNF